MDRRRSWQDWQNWNGGRWWRSTPGRSTASSPGSRRSRACSAPPSAGTRWSPASARGSRRWRRRRAPSPARPSPAWNGSIRCSRWGTGDRSWSRSRAGRASPARRAHTRRRCPGTACAPPIRTSSSSRRAASASSGRWPRCPRWRRAPAGPSWRRFAPAAFMSPTAICTSIDPARCCSTRPRSSPRSCTRRRFRPRTRAPSGAAGPQASVETRQRRATESPAYDWQTGISSIALTLTRAGSVATHQTVSATSSGVSGSAPA